jgi:hypothetical protein
MLYENDTKVKGTEMIVALAKTPGNLDPLLGSGGLVGQGVGRRCHSRGVRIFDASVDSAPEG